MTASRWSSRPWQYAATTAGVGAVIGLAAAPWLTLQALFALAAAGILGAGVRGLIRGPKTRTGGDGRQVTKTDLPAGKTAPLDLDAIEARANAATEGPWDVRGHAHPASGCRCLSCYEPTVGWTVDHPRALYCDDLVRSGTRGDEVNDFGRALASCDKGPLLSYEDAVFAAHAREDVPALVAEIRRLRAAPTEGSAR